MSMDTFKDRQQLEDVYALGTAPWEIWKDKASQTPYASLAL
jgi:glucose-1-phosphate cytidylyltransferase